MLKPSILATCIAATLLTACGGSSSDTIESIVPPPATVPPTTTITETTGVITGFGSVYINGVEYETDTSTISTDDNSAADELALEVGMIVSLSGEINADGTTGTASAIHYEEQVKGPLDSIDLVANTLIVLGQTISFDDLTSLDNIILVNLSPGDFLEISGFLNANGELYATRIAKKDGVTDLKIQGIVTLLDTAAQTFMIDDLTIDYSNAEFIDFTVETLVNDQEVRVKGDLTALVNNTFTISNIKLKSADDTHVEGDTRNIEGIITNFISASEFTVDGITIITDENTILEYGTLDSLALNVRVKIKGEYVGETLLAKEIIIHQQTDLKLEGAIQAVDLELQTVTVLNVTFSLSLQTKMEDESVTGERFFDIADLAVGDFVEIKGFVDADGNNIATKLKRQNEDEQAETELKGEISNVLDFGFSIVGVAITTTETTQFEDSNGDNISQAEFFALTLAGMLAEVEGNIVDNTFIATKVEIETPDNDNDAVALTQRTEFRGVIENLVDNTLVVSGHNVTLGETIEIKFNDLIISINHFWSILNVGDQIKIKGTIDEVGNIIAKSIELEIGDQANVAKIALWGSIEYTNGELSINGYRFEVDPNMTIEALGVTFTFDDFLAQIDRWPNIKVEGIFRDTAFFVSNIEVLMSDREAGKIKVDALVESVIDNGFIIAGYEALYTDNTLFFIDNDAVNITQFSELLTAETDVSLTGIVVIETLIDGTINVSISITEVTINTRI